MAYRGLVQSMRSGHDDDFACGGARTGRARRPGCLLAAANYLSVGQIYLLDNAPAGEPLRPEHVKPLLLGHWGTTPGLNFL